MDAWALTMRVDRQGIRKEWPMVVKHVDTSVEPRALYFLVGVAITINTECVWRGGGGGPTVGKA